MGTCYYDSWIFHTPLELRSENSNNRFYTNVYDKIHTGEIYPHQKLIPELKRTGYKKALYGQKPLDLFRTLLTDSRVETLIKAGQAKLLERIMDSGWKNIDNYWQSIRICIRNNYTPEDATLWCDYIDMLRYFGKDLHNAKYVCPTDLHAEHDRYMPLELRNENSNNKFYTNVYDKIHTGEIYPRQKLIPELKRSGYKKTLYGQKPLDLFRTLLSDSKAETLIKAGQAKLLERIMDSGWKNIDNYWQSIRICIRNNYTPEDATLWCDYIDMLRYFGKDLHNAKYVCPTDLHAEHDRYMHKKAKAEAQQEIEKLRDREPDFIQSKGKFFGIMFSDGNITVRVLESIEELILEGKFMHHCVGGYYSKKDSLILSATIDGKRLETVEVSLSKLAVIQCRGVCNQNTEYHNQIIQLVGQNMPLIEKRLAA